MVLAGVAGKAGRTALQRPSAPTTTFVSVSTWRSVVSGDCRVGKMRISTTRPGSAVPQMGSGTSRWRTAWSRNIGARVIGAAALAAEAASAAMTSAAARRNDIAMLRVANDGAASRQ